MNHSRGRLLAFSTAMLGLMVLVAAGMAARDWMLEEWYLRKLENGDEKQQFVAAQKLGEMGSERAVPLLELMRQPHSPASVQDGSNKLRFAYRSSRFWNAASALKVGTTRAHAKRVLAWRGFENEMVEHRGLAGSCLIEYGCGGYHGGFYVLAKCSSAVAIFFDGEEKAKEIFINSCNGPAGGLIERKQLLTR